MEVTFEDFYIGTWHVQPRLNRVAGRGEVIQLGPRVMRVLVCLVEAAGDVVTRDQLLENVWKDTVVTEESLTSAISDLRKVFGDDPRKPQVIETIRSVGYRLIAPIERDILPSSDGASRASEVVLAPSFEPRQQEVAPRRWGRLAVLALVVFMLGGVGSYLVFSDAPTAHSPLRPIPLTSYPGIEFQPAISPDGEHVVFSWRPEEAPHQNLYIKQVGAATPLQLTDHSGFEATPTWSPDGKAIAFIRVDEGGEAPGCGIYVLPVPGGDERQVATCQSLSRAALSWSPDGSFLAFSDRESGSASSRIYLLSLESLEVWPVTMSTSPSVSDYYPSFSPDGAYLAFARGTRSGTMGGTLVPVQGDVFLLSVQEITAGRSATVVQQAGLGVNAVSEISGLPEPRRLTDVDEDLFGIAWLANGKDLVYSSYNLWQVDVKDGTDPALLLNYRSFLWYPSMALKSDRMVYEQWSGDLDLWQVSLDPQNAQGPVQVATSTWWESNPTFSPDGSRLAFISMRSGQTEVWTSDADGDYPLQVTTLASFGTNAPRWSPDGSRLVFETRLEGNTDIYVVNAQGGIPRPLTLHKGDDRNPSWSQDGQWIYFGSNRSGSWQVWKLPVEGGAAEQVTQLGGFSATETLDGSELYYSRRDTAGLWKMPLSGGEEQQVVSSLTLSDWGNWVVHPDGIFLVEREGQGTPSLARFDLNAGTKELIRPIPGMVWEGTPSIAISPDGKSLLYTEMGQATADLMLVEGLN